MGEIVRELAFGLGGDDVGHLLIGGAEPEPGFTWLVGGESVIELQRPDAPGAYTLELEGWPFTVDAVLPMQRLRVRVNGRDVKSASLVEPFEVRCEIPWELLRGSPTISIELQHQDATRPCDISSSSDIRLLSIAVRRLRLYKGGVADDDVGPGSARNSPLALGAGDPQVRDEMLAFESLGGDCQFGFLQRDFGTEPHGLLRFANIRAEPLARLLQAKLEGVGSAANLEIRTRWTDAGLEYWAHETRYEFKCHVLLYEGASLAMIAAREGRRFELLARKLVRDLAERQKIFVFRVIAPEDELAMTRVWEALQLYGDNTLLWISQGDGVGAGPERLERGLLRAYAPDYDGRRTAATWLRLCRSALKMQRAAA